MAEKYLLRVTAGPTYDPSTHQQVLVNTPHATDICTPLLSASIIVRIQNYRGLPATSPHTSPYFADPHHAHDQYSISFRLLPHQPIPGSALVFGNDFDHPIRDRLPPGFGTALKIVKWAIDPGVDGDVYGDRPHLYGNALSSVNVLRVGGKAGKRKQGVETGNVQSKNEDGEVKEEEEKVVEEGGEAGGDELRAELGVPADAAGRKKWFLRAGSTEGWVWEAGREYWVDFFNPYLDFNQFALKLPGFSLSLLPYLGGDDYLRYVLKNKDTSDVYFVIVFSLVPREELEGGKSLSDLQAPGSGEGEEGLKGEKRDGVKGEAKGGFEPAADDLD